ncbi:MAG: hypothetical protein AB8F95_02905 [Bacteroidia bacterium]
MSRVKLIESIKKKFLQPKKEILSGLLIDFIQNKTTTIISEPAHLIAINVEFDTPFNFGYVIYPDLATLPEGVSFDTVIISCAEDGDWGNLSDILNNNGYEEVDDVWENKETADYFEEWDFYKALELDFFHQAWTDAKKKTDSKLRCFFFEHDVFAGVDADTGKAASMEDVKAILASEGFQIPANN